MIAFHADCDELEVDVQARSDRVESRRTAWEVSGQRKLANRARYANRRGKGGPATAGLHHRRNKRNYL